ncbi:MAG: hypothetical protein Q4P13_07715 [Psychrobacter sp.]|nr:hypothetical protein [Psychrobacter sp.]
MGSDSVKRHSNSARSDNQASTKSTSPKKVKKGNFQTQHTGLPPRKMS